MKRKILVLFALLSLSAACRSKYYESRSHRQDSLHLWQWEEFTLQYERLDSTGERATDRTIILARKAQSIDQSSRSDSVRRQQVGVKQKSKERKTSSLDFLLVGLLVGFGLALYLALRYRSLLSRSQSK